MPRPGCRATSPQHGCVGLLRRRERELGRNLGARNRGEVVPSLDWRARPKERTRLVPTPTLGVCSGLGCTPGWPEPGGSNTEGHSCALLSRFLSVFGMRRFTVRLVQIPFLRCENRLLTCRPTLAALASWLTMTIVILSTISCRGPAPPAGTDTETASLPPRVDELLELTDSGPRAVTILSPATGTSFYDTLQFSAQLPDLTTGQTLGDKFSLLVNGVATVTGSAQVQSGRQRVSLAWDATALPAGDYQLALRDEHESGALTDSPTITVTVKHTTVSLVSVNLNPRTVVGGIPSAVTVTLSGPAPEGGIAVPMFSSLPVFWTTVPSPAVVPAGASSVTLPVLTQAIGVVVGGQVTASFRSMTRSDFLTVTQTPGVRDVSATSVFEGGSSITATVTLNQTFATPSEVMLTTTNPLVTVPASVTVPAGQTTATFLVSTAQVSTQTTVRVNATFPANLTMGTDVTLAPSPTIASFSISPSQVLAGGSTAAILTFNGPVGSSGAVASVQCVTLEKHTSVIFKASFAEGARSGQIMIPTTRLDGGFVIYCNAAMNGLAFPTNAPLTVLRNLPVGNAQYDPILGAPSCNSVVAACDSGGLTDGRDNLNGAPEVNAPNTIHGSCPDDPGVNNFSDPANPGAHYHTTSSIDRLKVSTLDGSALAAGKMVRIEATVWQGWLDVFTASDANNPDWIFLTRFKPATLTETVVATTFTLPAGSLQAIRANGGFDLAPAACSPFNKGALVDHDDLVFATDNGGPPTNIGPTVNAGPDQTIGLPPTATLAGAVSDDGVPSPAELVVTWSKVSGPGSVTFSDVHAIAPTAQFGIAGAYTLRLFATDGVLSAADDVVVLVNPGTATNAPPIVSAGLDQTITLPEGATVAGMASDDGLPNPPGAITTRWTQVSGPVSGTAVFDDAGVLSPHVTFPLEGIYTLRLTASDALLSVADDVVITVKPQPPKNQAPVVNVGPDQSVTLPGTLLTSASAVTDDGLPNPPGQPTLHWQMVSGPSAVIFGAPTASQTTVTFTAAGTYLLRLTADDGALSSSDDLQVSVSPAPIINLAPVVDAGPNQTVTLPALARLVGTAADDGLPNPPALTSVAWSKVSGPGTVIFGAAGSRNTAVAFSAAGSYILRLTASDGALAASDTITVTVNTPTIKVQYRVSEQNPGDNQLRPRFNIVNVGRTAVALSSLKIRYWYTADGSQAQIASCLSARLGCSRLTEVVTAVTPARPNADRYLEFGFTSAAGNLAAGGQTGELQLRVVKSGSNFTEGNDYSYSALAALPPPSALIDWTRVTIYQGGARIWGTEP